MSPPCKKMFFGRFDKKSGFAYQPGGHPEYTTTAAGLLAMQVCGQYESPFVLGAADWLLDTVLVASRPYEGAAEVRPTYG